MVEKDLFCTGKKKKASRNIFYLHHVHIATKILNSYNFLSRCIRMIRSLAAQSISSHIHQRGVQQKRHLLLSILMFCTQPKVLVYTSPIPKKQWIIFPLLSEHFWHLLWERSEQPPGTHCCRFKCGSHPGRALWARSCGNFSKCDVDWAEREVPLQ